MTQKHSILIVSGIQVHPTQSGGHLRTVNLAKELAEYADTVSIYSFTGRRADYIEKTPSGWQAVTPKIKEFVDRSRLHGFLQWICYKLHLPPFWLTWYSAKSCPKTLQSLYAQADIVISDFPFLFRFLDKKSDSKLRILNTHNIEADLYKNKILRSYVDKIEREAVEAADVTFFCSESEKQHFETENTSGSYVIPNGIDEASYARLPAGELAALREQMGIPQSKRVFILTAARHIPNLEAFEKLKAWADENHELLKKLNALILVAGSVSDPMSAGDYFRADGRVESIFPYFQIADFALNPVQSGSGTNVKMLEFIAAKLPILSTVFGARGTELVAGESYVSFDFDTLGEKMAAVIDLVDPESMTGLAYEQNQHLVSMRPALQDFAKAYL